MPRVTLALLLALGVTGCAPTYQPGVDYDRRGLSRVEAVDIRWWKAQRMCQIHIIFWDGDIPKGIVIDDVDPRICGEKP